MPRSRHNTAQISMSQILVDFQFCVSNICHNLDQGKPCTFLLQTPTGNKVESVLHTIASADVT